MPINVLYGDTDSLFIKDLTSPQQSDLTKYALERWQVDLELDKHYAFVILSERKKNYIGVKEDKDGKRSLDIKGLTGKKRHTPPFIAKLFYGCCNGLLAVTSPEHFEQRKKEIVNLIRLTMKGMYNGKIPMEQMSFKVMMNKEISEYKNSVSGVLPQHVRVAQALGVAQAGAFVQYVKCKGFREKRLKTKVKMERIVIPKPLSEAKFEDLDLDKYEEFMESTLLQILDPMDITWEYIKEGTIQGKLDDWNNL